RKMGGLSLLGVWADLAEVGTTTSRFRRKRPTATGRDPSAPPLRLGEGAGGRGAAGASRRSRRHPGGLVRVVLLEQLKAVLAPSGELVDQVEPLRAGLFQLADQVEAVLARLLQLPVARLAGVALGL